MKFKEIKEDDKVYPGEYLFYKPTKQIVMCGAYMKEENKIKALADGKLLVDKIDSFQKIYLSNNQQQKRRFTKCKGCS